MKGYSNYVFDLYGTLVDIRTDEQSKTLWRRLSCCYGMHGAQYGPAELKNEYLRLCGLEQQSVKDEYYELELRNVFRKLYELKGLTASDSLVEETAIFFRITSTRKLKLYPWVTEAFKRIRDRGGRIYLLSNAQACFTEHELKLLRLDDKFDGIVLSSDAKVGKPNRRIIELLLSRYGLNTADSVMIGNDQHTDMAVARSVGMDGIFIKTETSGEYDVSLKVEREVLDGDIMKLFELMVI